MILPVAIITIFTIPHAVIIGTLCYTLGNEVQKSYMENKSYISKSSNLKSSNDTIEESKCDTKCRLPLTEAELLTQISQLKDCTNHKRIITTQPRPQQKDTVDPSPMKTELQHKYSERNMRYQRMSNSPMRRCAIRESSQICRGTSGLYHSAAARSPMHMMQNSSTFLWELWNMIFRLEIKSMRWMFDCLKSPMFQLCDEPGFKQEILQVRKFLRKTSRLMSYHSSSSFNSLSPMRHYLKDVKNAASTLVNRAYIYQYNALLHRVPGNSPMHRLCKDQDFKDDLQSAGLWLDVIIKSRRYHRSYFHVCVEPLLEHQYRIIMPRRIRDIMSDSLLLVKIISYNRMAEQRRQSESPMRNYCRKTNLCQNIRAVINDKRQREHRLMTSPQRMLTLKNRNQIQLAVKRMNRKTNSPMRMCIVKSKAELLAKVNEHHKNYIDSHDDAGSRSGIDREAYAAVMHELLDVYPEFSRKINLNNYCIEKGIPRVRLLPRHLSYSEIIFPRPEQASEFLTACNLEDYEIEKLFLSPEIQVEKCYNMFPHSLTKIDIINAAESLKNMSNTVLNDEQSFAHVRVFTDLNKIEVLPSGYPINSTAKEARIKMIRRDYCRFTLDQLKKCRSVVEKHMKRYPGVNFEFGFLDSWLSKDMIVQLRYIPGPNDDVNIHNLASDLIISLNMVKNIIFASLRTTMCWVDM